MEWSIQEVARAAGTTSRTLRHYQEIGLLEPSRVGHNGYRYYDDGSLLTLQRILLLRQLGLGLPEIAKVVHGRTETTAALRGHRKSCCRNGTGSNARSRRSGQQSTRRKEASS